MAQQKEKPKEEPCVEERELDESVRRANPLNDVLFKYLFASKDNKGNLLRLLNDVLGPERRIMDVEYLLGGEAAAEADQRGRLPKQQRIDKGDGE